MSRQFDFAEIKDRYFQVSKRLRDLKCPQAGMAQADPVLVEEQRGLVGARDLHRGWRAERGEPVQVRVLVQVETEEIGSILIFDRLVHQISETRDAMADHHFGEQ